MEGKDSDLLRQIIGDFGEFLTSLIENTNNLIINNL